MVYNLNYYEQQYQKHGVYDVFEKDTAIYLTKNIHRFFKSENELDTIYFKEDEISHLTDVKVFLDSLFKLYFLSIIILFSTIIYYHKHKLNFLTLLKNSSILIIALIILFGLIYLIFGFDFLFEFFHKIFFVDNYAFDPNISNMKALFPNSFFQEFLFNILIRIILVSSLILLINIYHFFV